MESARLIECPGRGRTALTKSSVLRWCRRFQPCWQHPTPQIYPASLRAEEARLHIDNLYRDFRHHTFTFAMALVETIADATVSCRQRLELCLSIKRFKAQGWAENRLADFNVWDSGLGASSTRRASLEDRLTLKPHVRMAVLNLLLIYRNCIDVCIELGNVYYRQNTPDRHRLIALRAETRPAREPQCGA